MFPVDRSIEVRDLSGAGDSWMEEIRSKIFRNKRAYESIQFANEKTIVVQKEELQQYEKILTNIRRTYR